MKKFNKLVCMGILGLMGLFCGNVFAAQTGFNTPEINDHQTNWTRVGNVIFFNDYTENASGEIFTGSTTTSGGTSTVSQGLVDARPYLGTKLFILYGTPTVTNGSVTVKIYGWCGTNTVSATRGTEGALLLNGPSGTDLAFTGGIGSSTSVSVTQNVSTLAVSVNVTSGTVSSEVTMTNINTR